jgi:ATP-binding protein involved in chromosome partitioning
MRIAVPCENNQVATHFGHARQIVFLDIDEQSQKITAEEIRNAPPHEPGAFPKWIADHGGQIVLAGGMGSRAVQLFEQNGIKVVVGIASMSPQQAAEQYLAGSLSTDDNFCDH